MSDFWRDLQHTQQSGTALTAMSSEELPPASEQPPPKAAPPPEPPAPAARTVTGRIHLTLLDGYRSNAQIGTPPDQVTTGRASFNALGYCAVSVSNDARATPPLGSTYPTQIWIYKRVGNHWNQVSMVSIDPFGVDAPRTEEITLGDNMTICCTGDTGYYVHRWKYLGNDTWAVDSPFRPVSNEYAHARMSSDGNVCAARGAKIRIYVGFSGTQSLAQTITAPTNTSWYSHTLSSDGKKLFVGAFIYRPATSDYSAQLWIYASTTLGANSWVLVSQIPLTQPYSYIGRIIVTPDQKLIAVGGYHGNDTHVYIDILQLVSGSSYAVLGSYAPTTMEFINDTRYSETWYTSFGMSAAGKLVIPYWTGGASIYNNDSVWSVADVTTISGAENVLDRVDKPAAVAALDYASFIDVDPTGNYACFVGANLDPPTMTTANNIHFFLLGEIPRFWQDNMKVLEYDE